MYAVPLLLSQLVASPFTTALGLSSSPRGRRASQISTLANTLSLVFRQTVRYVLQSHRPRCIGPQQVAHIDHRPSVERTGAENTSTRIRPEVSIRCRWR